MRYTNHAGMIVAGALAALCILPMSSRAVEDAAPPQSETVAGAWQHHNVTFNYVGFTSLYTCSGLEDHVRQILLHLGARQDLKVAATGCPGWDSVPSRTAWVRADFYTLAPAPESAGSDTVRARWTPLVVTPQRPSFMGDGDCELVNQMKDLVTRNFSLRDVQYRTSCVPNEQHPDSYAVKGQALRAVSTPKPVAG
ncbi:MAG: hypothetical protein WA803_02445 [Steroidobacteraceae bacterium]